MARSSKSDKLELHFRPEDPYSHPAFGQLQRCNNFLLRISRNKCSGRQNAKSASSQSNVATQSIEPNGETQRVDSERAEHVASNLSADIVARIREAYHFNGMVDYQHVIAIHADAARRKGGRWPEMKGSSGNVCLDDVNEENLMILAPTLFSPKDLPDNIVLRPSVALSSKKKQEGAVQLRWEMEIEPCLAIDFNIKEIPKKVNWDAHIPQGSDQWTLHMAVSKLFDERPIWPKSSISERLENMGLKCGVNMLKRLLFRTAYYFGSGPFHRFWIKKGYDPRKDPESRRYQRIDFRVPPPLRSYCDASNGMKHRWEDICAFRVFPHKCQTYLQLCELQDDYIQQEILKLPTRTICTSSTGWFSSYLLDSLRLCIASRFLSVFPRPGAESLLTSASERFEKSKKMRSQIKNLKPVEEGELHINQELTGEEGKTNDDEEDEEENEMEDDDGEELDVHDATYLGGEDADYPLRPHLYLGRDNVSKNYLQELFESFPSAEAAATQLHGEDSDGEYVIYEQDTDGNYSDDDFY